MRYLKNIQRLTATVCLMALGVSGLHAEVGTGRYVVVVNRENSYKASPYKIKRDIADIYLRKSMKWSDGKKVEAFYPLVGAGEEEAFLRNVLEMDRGQYERYWSLMKQKSGTVRARTVSSNLLLVKFLQKYKGGIGVMKRVEAERYHDKVSMIYSFD